MCQIIKKKFNTAFLIAARQDRSDETLAVSSHTCALEDILVNLHKDKIFFHKNKNELSACSV